MVAAAVLGLLLLMGVTACGPLAAPAPQPSKDFWGNDIPKESPDACMVQSGPAVDPQEFNPAVHQRPADVLPGNAWIVIEYELRALPPAGQASRYDYCVPADVHVYVRPSEADVVLHGVNSFEAGPFDFRVTTPWVGRYIVLQYDPTKERFEGRPPQYEIHMQAKYLSDRDGSAAIGGPEPLALGCRLKIDGAAIAADIAVIAVRDNVECVFVGDTFHTY